MTTKIKPYEKLEFTDDFMFAAVMNSSKEICKQVIELILGRKIRDISYPEYQHSIIIRYDSRGVRLDVTVTDMDGTVFDLEMQAVKETELPKRCRYYHGMLSLEQVEKGEGYDNLKETYVVFILKNGLGKNMRKPVYMFENYCKEEKLSLNDGAKTVFLNATCETDGLSDELKAFVEYIKSGKCDTDDNLVNAISRSVTEARGNVKWRSEYMTFNVKLMEERMEALAEGEAIGRAKEKAESEAKLAEVKAESEGKIAEEKAKSEAKLAEVKAESEAKIAEEKAESEAKLAENYASLVKDGILTFSDAVKRSGLAEEKIKKYLCTSD